MKRKTLVVLSPAFPAKEKETHWVPTQQLFVRTLSARFPDLQVMVLTLYYPGKTRFLWHGVEVKGFDGGKWKGVGRMVFWGAVWRALRRISRDNEVIGLFSFWCGECALIGHYWGLLYGVRHLCWICGQDARAGNKMVKFIRPRSGELIAMSDFLGREFYRNHGVRPGYVIPNGIEPGAFPGGGGSGFGSRGSRDRDIDILGAGSLSALKQYMVFVEIVRSLAPSVPHIRSVICGEGEDRQALEGFIREHGLGEHITLVGEKAHEDVLGLMRRTKVFLHTSSYEGFGVVCLEALYAGAQVISFCKPMDEDIPRWHIARDAEEMRRLAGELLSEPAPVYTPVLRFTMEESVGEVMRLFEGGEGGIVGRSGVDSRC